MHGKHTGAKKERGRKGMGGTLLFFTNWGRMVVDGWLQVEFC